MTAREMFEELGYHCEFINEGLSSIIYKRFFPEGDYKEIGFYGSDHTVNMYSRYQLRYDVTVDKELFTAIQKQIEELGWV